MHPNFTQAFLDVLLLWILTAPHEFAHAWVATRLGDDTPRMQGRVTLNPLAHVDWIGTALLPLFTSLLGAGFIGWGKPVQTNPGKLRGGINGLAVVSVAGPASNVVMAVVLAVVTVAAAHVSLSFAQFTQRGVVLSLYLAILNMLPIPPLDGSKLLLAMRIPMVIYQELARAGFLILVLAFSASRVGVWMSEWAYRGAVMIFRLVG